MDEFKKEHNIYPMNKLHYKACITILLLAITFLASAQYNTLNPKYEMRGVWVATVANIDWPSQAGLSEKEQKQEALSIITHAKKLGLNTIFLQVRPASDVLYHSKLEPWSSVLTGHAGQSPKYDPLEYWIQEAHNQGLELHAWINPYRASMNLEDELPQKHPFHTTPKMFVEYGNKLYYNPAEPASKAHINKVVKELVSNYAIDGIHMDDYFYPYPIKDKVFPDSISFERYGKATYTDINTWRRENVNQAILAIQKTIKDVKPWVQFGISPFGVWRNKKDDPRGSDSNAGTTNYDGLHADILLWMENKWIDYVAPQLYWGTSHPIANYTKLANWWNDNHYEIPVYIGHGIYKIGNDKPDWQDSNQLPFQLNSVRHYQNLNGSIFFSYKHFNRELQGLQDSLQTNFYKSKAITPHIESNKTRNTITIKKIKAGGRKIKWKVNKVHKNTPTKYIIYMYKGLDAFNPDDPKYIRDICYQTNYKLPKKSTSLTENYIIRVAALNAYNTEGALSKPVQVSY